MGDWIGYGGVLLIVLISGAGLFPDWFTKTNYLVRWCLGIVLLVAMVFSLRSLYNSNQQHKEDIGKIDLLNQKIADSEKRQETNAKLFVKGQNDQSDLFAKNYGNLSDKLRDVEVGVKTADLRETVASLQRELKATQTALIVPKATLLLSAQDTDPPSLAASLPENAGIVHVMFTVFNLSDVDAIDGELVLMICDSCEFVTVPNGFDKPTEGDLATQRNFQFKQIPAHSKTYRMKFDVKVKDRLPSFKYGIKVSCRTCVAEKGNRPTPEHTAIVTLIRQ